MADLLTLSIVLIYNKVILLLLKELSKQEVIMQNHTLRKFLFALLFLVIAGAGIGTAIRLSRPQSVDHGQYLRPSSILNEWSKKVLIKPYLL